MPVVEIIKFIPIAVFVLLLAMQALFPRRELPAAGFSRIGHNLLLFLINTVIMRMAVPITLLAVSIWASQHSYGVFNIISVPVGFSSVLCVVVLDFAIYWQHVLTHRWPLLWRMHKVHHADTEMDVTTAIRFHPIELFLSLAYKSLAVVALGAPVMAVLIFELLLFVGPAFNHSNVKLPPKLDLLLRYFIATPDTHRAHHSTIIAEQNTNYGFFLIWWDKLFGTYTHSPKDGHETMSIGLVSQEDQCPTIDTMLIAPFRPLSDLNEPVKPETHE